MLPHSEHRGSSVEYACRPEAVRGSREELRRPIIHNIVGIVSPLFIPEDDVEMIFLVGEYGIPTGMCIMPNAETLGSFTLCQLANTDHASLYYILPLIMDTATGAGLQRIPESDLLFAALTQLGREFYKMPVELGGFFADSVIWEQLIFQKTQNILMTFLAGANLLLGAGLTDTGLANSPVQLIMDNEITAIARRIWQGVNVTEDTLGFDAIGKVGPRGTFLTNGLTLKYLRTGEFLRTAIFDRDPRMIWHSKGAEGLEQRAREKAISILEEHQVEPLSLSEDVLMELHSIEEKADQELAD